MDENFDGRISYNELAQHVNKLGFQLSLKELQGTGRKVEQFLWRDKALETIILSVNKVLNQTPFEEYFAKFDGDHDNFLSPTEFRQSLLSIKNQQLKVF